jgi:cation diffusion facilitator family transporter
MSAATKPAPMAPDERRRAIHRVLWAVLGMNLVSAAAKLLTAQRAGSLALLADGIHALLDASSNVVGLVGTWLASRPADAGHPYGHQRFEAIAASVIALFIVGGLYAILDQVVAAIGAGRTSPPPTLFTAAVVAATTVFGFAVSRYERRRGRALGSAVLVADAAHTLSDALGSIVVLSSFAAAALGLVWADLVAAVIVAALIGRTAWSLLAANVQVLADAVRLDPAEVERIAVAVPGVRSVHKIRSRGQRDHVHVDLHVQLDPTMSLEDAHAKGHEVAAAIRRHFPEVKDVLVHTEPSRPPP